jgi:hypothetical protein
MIESRKPASPEGRRNAMSAALRAQFISSALLVLTGIWLTGFNHAHWSLYIPVAALTFAGITGICPGLMFWKKLGLK